MGMLLEIRPSRSLDGLRSVVWREMGKRLVKSKKKWLFGVARGLADYFGVPPIVVRSAFVAATFISMLGLVAYFLFVVWMPKPPETDC